MGDTGANGVTIRRKLCLVGQGKQTQEPRGYLDVGSREDWRVLEAALGFFSLPSKVFQGRFHCLACRLVVFCLAVQPPAQPD